MMGHKSVWAWLLPAGLVVSSACGGGAAATSAVESDAGAQDVAMEAHDAAPTPPDVVDTATTAVSDATSAAAPAWPAPFERNLPRFALPAACPPPPDPEPLAVPSAPISDADAYYVLRGGRAGERGVFRQPRAGGAATAVFMHDDIEWLGLLGKTLFVLTTSEVGLPTEIWRVPSQGGAPLRLLEARSGFIDTVVPLPEGIYYSSSTTNGSSLRRLSLDGASDALVAADARLEAHDATSLYWTKSNGGGTTLFAVDRPTGAPPVSPQSPRVLGRVPEAISRYPVLVDEGAVYLLGPRALWRVAQPSGAVTEMASVAGQTQRTLAQDDAYVYFVDGFEAAFGLPSPSRLRVVAKDGRPPFDAAAFVVASTLFVDGDAVHIGTGGTGALRLPRTFSVCDDGTRTHAWPGTGEPPSRAPEPSLPPGAPQVAGTAPYTGAIVVTPGLVTLAGAPAPEKPGGVATLVREVTLGRDRFRLENGDLLKGDAVVGRPLGERAIAFERDAVSWLEAAGPKMKLRRQTAAGSSTLSERPLRALVAIAAAENTLVWLENGLRHRVLEVAKTGGPTVVLVDDVGPAVTTVAAHGRDVYWMRGADAAFTGLRAAASVGRIWVSRPPLEAGAARRALPLTPEIPVTDIAATNGRLYFSAPSENDRFTARFTLYEISRWW